MPSRYETSIKRAGLWGLIGVLSLQLPFVALNRSSDPYEGIRGWQVMPGTMPGWLLLPLFVFCAGSAMLYKSRKGSVTLAEQRILAGGILISGIAALEEALVPLVGGWGNYVGVRAGVYIIGFVGLVLTYNGYQGVRVLIHSAQSPAPTDPQ